MNKLFRVIFLLLVSSLFLTSCLEDYISQNDEDKPEIVDEENQGTTDSDENVLFDEVSETTEDNEIIDVDTYIPDDAPVADLDTPVNENQKPVVSFLKPQTNIVPKDLGVVVEATDPDGEIVEVFLYIDNELVRREGGAPYEWGTANSNQEDAELLNLMPGDHTLMAVAVDNEGAENYKELTVTVEESVAQLLEFPIRAAFYYIWYPNTWNVWDDAHENLHHVFYTPELGYYASDSVEAIDKHIEYMEYAKIDVAIISWFGPSENADTVVPLLLERTKVLNSNLKWAIYYEQEGFGDPSVEELQSDLAFLKQNYSDHSAFAKIDGKPVVFVYDGSVDVANRWAQADPNDDFYIGLKVFQGYRDCPNQPDAWHQYGPDSPAQHHSGNSYVIAPGFWRADKQAPLLERDIDRWYQNVRDMVASNEPWQMIISFNEWGEGTAVEAATDWESDTEYGHYLDALHTDGQRTVSSNSGINKPDTAKVRLANYNVLRTSVFPLDDGSPGKGDRSENFARVAKAIDADIWTMQELLYDGNDQPGRTPEGVRNNFKNMTGVDWHMVYHNKYQEFIFSRYPIAASATPGHRVHWALIDVPPAGITGSNDLLVINVHFVTDGQPENVVNTINQAISGQLDNVPSNVSIVVTGDFNNGPNGSRYQMVKNAVGHSDIRPAWLETNDVKVTHGSVVINGDSFTPSGSTIDYLFLRSNGYQVANSFILNTLILDQATLDGNGLRRVDVAVNPKNGAPDGISIAFDHLPLILDLK